jgi:hypothetical protein
MYSQIIQTAIAVALIVIAIKAPWQQASAEPQIATVDIRGINPATVGYLSYCIALKIKQGSDVNC